MSRLGTAKINTGSLGPEASQILETLEMDSPLSTKQLKKAVDLVGRHFEGAYTRALKELWAKLLIVGYGEVDEGAFPSLAVGATKNIFEDLFNASREMNGDDAGVLIDKHLPKGGVLRKYFDLIQRQNLSTNITLDSRTV